MLIGLPKYLGGGLYYSTNFKNEKIKAQKGILLMVTKLEISRADI